LTTGIFLKVVVLMTFNWIAWETGIGELMNPMVTKWMEMGQSRIQIKDI